MRRPTQIHANGSDLWMNSHGMLNSSVDNVLCVRLAKAAQEADHAGPDEIDRGLVLLKELERQGFGVIYLGEPE